MPLRHLFTKLGVKHPVAYSNFTLAMGVLACMFIACWVSVNVALHAEDAGRARSRVTACAVAVRMAEVYRGADTPTGKQAKAAWDDMAREFSCATLPADVKEEAPPK
jgi:hypothetical protein